jgi:shikimate kinase
MADAEFHAERPIVLIGPMAVGKSTLGRRLAERLGLPFVDSDEEVEEAEGLRVAEIFDRSGEAAFRLREAQVLARLAAGPPMIIAAGGGAVLDDATRALLLARCTLVWLDAGIETLARRLEDSRRDRPLLRARDPAAALAELAERRRLAYAESHLRIDAEGSLEDVADRVVAALKRGT